MRRLLRWCFNGLCLLSLLACVGAGWLWWRSHSVVDDLYLTVPRHTFVRLTSSSGMLWLEVAKGWPRAEPMCWRVSKDFSASAATVGPFIGYRNGLDRCLEWARCGLSGHYGTGITFVDAGGSPLTTLPDDGSADYTESRPVREWSVLVPQWMPFTLFALPPVTWLALRARHLHVLRRRRRLGLCRRCGYDLTANTSGVCSECGMAVEAGRRVTA